MSSFSYSQGSDAFRRQIHGGLAANHSSLLILVNSFFCLRIDGHINHLAYPSSAHPVTAIIQAHLTILVHSTWHGVLGQVFQHLTQLPMALLPVQCVSTSRMFQVRILAYATLSFHTRIFLTLDSIHPVQALLQFLRIGACLRFDPLLT